MGCGLGRKCRWFYSGNDFRNSTNLTFLQIFTIIRMNFQVVLIGNLRKFSFYEITYVVRATSRTFSVSFAVFDVHDVGTKVIRNFTSDIFGDNVMFSLGDVISEFYTDKCEIRTHLSIKMSAILYMRAVLCLAVMLKIFLSMFFCIKIMFLWVGGRGVRE